MKVKSNFIFIIFSCLFCFSCAKEEQIKLKELKNYITVTSLSIKESFSILLFIPGNQCKNCVQMDASKLSTYLNNNIYIFTAIPEKQFKNFKNVYYDRGNNLMSLSYVDFENKIVVLKDGEIIYSSKLNLPSFADITGKCIK